MRKTSPEVSVTKSALVIRIPWQALREGLPRRSRQSRFSVADVLQLVEEGRRANRLGKTRVIDSLRELIA